MPDLSVLGDQDARFVRTRDGLDARIKQLSVRIIVRAVSAGCRLHQAASNTKHNPTDQLVEHPGMPGATAGQQRTVFTTMCPFTAWWDCTELQLFELVHSAP